MPVKDFSEWAVPPLMLPHGEKTYLVPPPTVENADKIMAAAVLGELRLNLVRGEETEQVRQAMLAVNPDEHFALTDAVYAEMKADGVPKGTIDRMAYYAVFYWARGEQYADELASLMWGPEVALQAAAEASADIPKALRSSRPRSGRNTA